MPKYIIAQRTFTYDVEEAKKTWAELHDGEVPDDDDIFEMCQEWAYEDMRSPASRHDMTWVDEDGNPLD